MVTTFKEFLAGNKFLASQAVVALFVALLIAAQPAQAQTQQELNLTISPPITYLKVAPGTQQTHTISVENTGDSPTTVTPQIVDFSINSETGQPYLEGNHSFPYFTMPDAALKPVTIEPNQVAQLQLRIEPPETAPDQEFPLSVLFSSAEAGETVDSGSTQVGGAVASNLIVLVSDKNQLDKKLVVTDFGAPRVVDSFRGFSINPTLTNERFSTSTASGSASLTSWTGKTIAEYEIYPDNVLGFSDRPIRAQDPTTSNGESLPQVDQFNFKPAFMLGPYKLTIQLDNDGTTDSFTQTVIALPFSIVVAIIIGLIVAVIYWYKIRTPNTLKL